MDQVQLYETDGMAINLNDCDSLSPMEVVIFPGSWDIEGLMGSWQGRAGSRKYIKN